MLPRSNSDFESVKRLLAIDSSANNEGSAKTLKSLLTENETQALLQQVPAVYNTQINDVLLTALIALGLNGAAIGRCTPTSKVMAVKICSYEDVDLSRTVGWFTSIFPVCLEMPESGANWQPGSALKSIKKSISTDPAAGDWLWRFALSSKRSRSFECF